MMDLGEALHRLDTVRDQAARGEARRSWHPAALAVSGFAGLLAALLQPDLSRAGFVAWWTGCAVVAALIGGLPTLLDYARQDDAERRATRLAWRQFLPCLLAGGVATWAMARSEECVPLLPGLWALLFGLGAFAAMPYLPPGAWLVAAWYLGSGAVLLLAAGSPSPWAVAVPFGVGQFLAALVMARGRERDG